mmetsp:Transcript_29392/g.39263  ORF Transcript_29392/g.39263 Transcript_29392/m.39263 type:complete len:95 (+) Transcript_29392:358-642(+)
MEPSSSTCDSRLYGSWHYLAKQTIADASSFIFPKWKTKGVDYISQWNVQNCNSLLNKRPNLTIFPFCAVFYSMWINKQLKTLDINLTLKLVLGA